MNSCSLSQNDLIEAMNVVNNLMHAHHVPLWTEFNSIRTAHTEMTRLSQPCDKVVTTMSTIDKVVTTLWIGCHYHVNN